MEECLLKKPHPAYYSRLLWIYDTIWFFDLRLPKTWLLLLLYSKNIRSVYFYSPNVLFHKNKSKYLYYIMCGNPVLKKNIFGDPVIPTPWAGFVPQATYFQPLKINLFEFWVLELGGSKYAERPIFKFFFFNRYL